MSSFPMKICTILLATPKHLVKTGSLSKRPLLQVKRRLHTCSRLFGVFEPDDVGLGPEIPEYEELNVKIRGYDFVLVEAFAKYIHNTAKQLGISSDSWATPSQTSEVHLYKPNSITIESKYELIKSERVVQLQDLPSTMLPILMDVMKSHVPEGVEVTLKEATPEEEEYRYIPEKDLIALQERLKDIQDEKDGKKKKKTFF